MENICVYLVYTRAASQEHNKYPNENFIDATLLMLAPEKHTPADATFPLSNALGV